MKTPLEVSTQVSVIVSSLGLETSKFLIESLRCKVSVGIVQSRMVRLKRHIALWDVLDADLF